MNKVGPPRYRSLVDGLVHQNTSKSPYPLCACEDIFHRLEKLRAVFDVPTTCLACLAYKEPDGS